MLFHFQIQNYTYLVWCTHRGHDLSIPELVFRGVKKKKKIQFLIREKKVGTQVQGKQYLLAKRERERERKRDRERGLLDVCW